MGFLYRRTLCFTGFLLLVLPLAQAQERPIAADVSPKAAAGSKVLEYDVVSVKLHPSGDHNMQFMEKPDGISLMNTTLKNLVASAYGIRQDLVSGGPAWVDSTGFDFEAKVAGSDVEAFKNLRAKQRNGMLQALLADRFKLKVHTETKILPMYDLVVAKGGPKLKVSAPIEISEEEAKDSAAKHRGGYTMGPGIWKGERLSMESITNQLSYIVNHKVIDKTGLTGTYDMDLKWTPEEAGPPNGDASGEFSSSIFTAVQEQLGLKLNATKGPIETLTIDFAEMPSAN